MKTPLVVGLIFCLGMGLGIGWKLGYIPLKLGPTPTAQLEESDSPAQEDATDELLASSKASAPPAWTVAQGEPPVEEGVNLKITDAVEPPLRDVSDDSDVPVIRLNRKRPLAKRPAKVRPVSRQFPDDRVRPATYQEETDEQPTPREPKLALDEPAEKPVPEAANRFAEIDEKLAAGEFLAAQKMMSKLYWNSGHNDPELMERLDATAAKIFFSPQPHFIEPYVVQSGDQLRKIAGKYNLSWEYLARLNKTDPRRIREGQKLKVLKGPFAAVVNLKEFALTIHLQGYFVKRYQVGIGKDGSSPIGKFPVLGKLENPQYTDPDGKVIEGDDPKNPLGERWIDLGDSYGIHGTIEPDSIGKAASRGCIRMRDADIIEVYNLLVKDSIVEIRE